MKDSLITLAFAASIFILIYVVGAGFASFVAWDLSLFDVSTWSEVGRILLGGVGLFLGWAATMFCIDDMTYKHKYWRAKREAEEAKIVSRNIFDERCKDEGPYRCRYTSVRVW